MPNRAHRRANDPTLDKWLHVEDDHGDPYDIYLRDVSAKDEADFLMLTEGKMGGLCDLFLEQRMTLVGIAGLIWSQRRHFEKKLTLLEVMKTVSLATLDAMELHDPREEDDPLDGLPADDPQRRLAEMRAGANASMDEFDPSEGLPGFGESTVPSGHGSGPSTD